jgi:hypothetical protein
MQFANPLEFVGTFDWRSVLLAVLFMAPWLIALAWTRLRSGWVWVAFVASAALFPVSIAWVQIPIQTAINQLLEHFFTIQQILSLLLLFGFPAVAVSGLVQEGVKLLVSAGALRMVTDRRRDLAGLAVGAASGAGFGAFEAFWVFNTTFGQGWSWATFQLLSWTALLPFIERAMTVPFHIGAAALAAYFLATGRWKTGYLVAAGAHTLVNYGVILLQAGVLNATTIEIWIGVITLIVIGLALWLRWRPAKPLTEPATGEEEGR